MSLDERAARPLTSREIARLLAGFLGSVATYSHVDDIIDAMKHFDEHSDTYIEVWRKANEVGKVDRRA